MEGKERERGWAGRRKENIEQRKGMQEREKGGKGVMEGDEREGKSRRERERER